MNIFSVISFGKDILFFLFVWFGALYIPGKYILNKLALSRDFPDPFSFPTIVGLLFFTLSAYLFSWMHLTILMLPLLIVIDGACLVQFGLTVTVKKSNRVPLFVASLIAFIFSLTMLTAGIHGTSLRYHSDDIIHLGYIQELIHHFPPDNPGVSGIPLLGYHFFSDFIAASVSRTFGISPVFLYFFCVPILVSFLWSFLTYTLVVLWRKRTDAGLWAVFLTMFGGSFGYILRLAGHPQVALRSTFGIEQPYDALLNPPFAISCVVILAALICLLSYIRSGRKAWLILLALFVGLSSVFKVYAGMLLISAFIFFVFTEIWKKKFFIIPVAIFAALLCFGTYALFAGKGNYLIFHPLWPTHTVLREGMPWYNYDDKISTYGRLGMQFGIWKVELYGIFLYVAGNLGTRLLGLIPLLFLLIKRRTLPSRFSFFVCTMTGVALFIPLFFIQSVKVFEITQLSWYYPFLMAILAAYGLPYVTDLGKIRIVRLLIALIIVIATLPSAYESFIENVYPAKQRLTTQLSDPMLGTMAFLKKDPSYDKTVLEMPPEAISPTHIDILSWYRTTLPYIAAFGGKRSYFHSQNIDFPNVPLTERTDTLARLIFANTVLPTEATYAATLTSAKEELTANNIHYIISPYRLKLAGRIEGMKNVNTTAIYFTYSLDR